MAPVLEAPSRRVVLKTAALAGAALVIPFEVARGQEAAGKPKQDVNPFQSWVRIDSTGKVTLLSSRSEMGQGISSALPMVLAEELEIEWKDIHVEQAPTDARLFGSQGTGGSGSVTASWMPLRKAGAAARTMLVEAAAKQWNVKPEQCTVQNGAVSYNGKTLKYGELVEAASNLPVPDFDKVALKKASDFRIIGTKVDRKDIPAKTDGSAKFGIDVRVPGMVYASVERCPVFGGKVKSFDATKAKAIAGVQDVFEIAPGPDSIHSQGGVAVVADSTWIAMKARKALQIDWEFGPHAAESSETLRKQFRRTVDTPQKVIFSVGDTDALISAAPADKKVESDYELPFQAHACMEPMNCTVRMEKDRAEVWAPAQGPEWVQGTVAEVAGITPDKVKVNITLMGGGFGRRYQADFALEAAQIAKKMLGKPVQLVWSREDDMTHDFYRPASYHRISGAVDANGDILAWKHLSTSTSIAEWWEPKSPPESSELGCLFTMPYIMKSYKLEFAPAQSGVPRAWWRSVEASSIGFVMESYMDELAHAAGVDPYEFRMRHLDATRMVKHPIDKDAIALDCSRMRGVLKLAADKAGWGGKLPAGQGRGIAAHYCFNSYAANVAEVTVANGAVHVNRIVSAVDIGTAVSPEGIRAQVESAVVYGLTAALKSQITVLDGRAVQTNFNKFGCLRMNETPVVEVHVVKSDVPPTGIGEPGLPPVAPAVMNAVFAITGKRIRRLPFNAKDLLA